MIGFWCNIHYSAVENLGIFFEMTHLAFLILRNWISMEVCTIVGAII